MAQFRQYQNAPLYGTSSHHQETPIPIDQAVAHGAGHAGGWDERLQPPINPPSYTSLAPSHAGTGHTWHPRQVTPQPSHRAAFNNSPEPYRSQSRHDGKGAIRSQRSTDVTPTESPHVPGAVLMPRPCVIPQISNPFRGAFFSPFARAYVPQLEAHGIGKEDFVAFIDGLNEAFIAHPIFRGLTALGGVMSMFYGIHPVQWAGMGLQTASGIASAATSFLRTKAYVKATNAELFHPAGLHLSILTTKKMMAKIGHPEQELKLSPPEDSHLERGGFKDPNVRNDGRMDDDPRVRRVKALEGYVMALDFDVPAEVMPDNLLKKMGASQAARSGTKQEERLMKKREKGQEKYLEKLQEAEKKHREGDEDIAKIERKIAKERAKLDRAMERCSEKDRDKALRNYEKEGGKLREDLEKEIRKRDEDVAKEMKHANKKLAKIDKKETKVANKMRWLVIDKFEGDEPEDDVDSDSADADDVDTGRRST